jgi:hypothetical protein
MEIGWLGHSSAVAAFPIAIAVMPATVAHIFSLGLIANHNAGIGKASNEFIVGFCLQAVSDEHHQARDLLGACVGVQCQPALEF